MNSSNGDKHSLTSENCLVWIWTLVYTIGSTDPRLPWFDIIYKLEGTLVSGGKMHSRMNRRLSAERKLPCMNINIGICSWEHRSPTALIWYYVQIGRYFGIRWKMHSRMKRRMQHIFYMDTIDEVFGIKGASVNQNYKAEEGGLWQLAVCAVCVKSPDSRVDTGRFLCFVQNHTLGYDACAHVQICAV